MSEELELVDTDSVRLRADRLAAALQDNDDWLWNAVADMRACADEIDRLRLMLTQ